MPFCVSVVNYGSETAMVKQNVTDTDEYGLLQQELPLCALHLGLRTLLSAWKPTDKIILSLGLHTVA